nr:RecName: Full=Neutral protease 2 homolog BDCG_00922; AltName: Full=Deuterolysin BDCG_00922; Flags: Precursor [Blastomyces dermatitidis ER-3]
MRSPQSILAIVAFATTAIAGVVPSTEKRADDIPELDVKLTQVEGTLVKAVVTNNGDEDLNILNLNFFKDTAPVKKVSVYSQGAEVPFAGVRLRHKTSGLSPEVFTYLGPGESFEDEFDVAFTADLSQGGRIVVKAEGFASTTDTDGDTLSGVVHYKSNELEIDVDGKAAAKNFASLNQFSKRTRLTGCTGSRGSAATRAIRDSAPLAAMAAGAARNGGRAFTQYFKTNDQQVRNLVAARFDAVAREASSTTSGRTTYYCDDPYGICSPNVLAYALPSRNIISNCPAYYSLSHLTWRCHGQDRVTTSIHEFTHTPGVFSPGTDDLAYGHQAATSLSTWEALNNADSFSLFANERADVAET